MIKLRVVLALQWGWLSEDLGVLSLSPCQSFNKHQVGLTEPVILPRLSKPLIILLSGTAKPRKNDATSTHSLLLKQPPGIKSKLGTWQVLYTGNKYGITLHYEVIIAYVECYIRSVWKLWHLGKNWLTKKIDDVIGHMVWQPYDCCCFLNLQKSSSLKWLNRKWQNVTAMTANPWGTKRSHLWRHRSHGVAAIWDLR